MRAELSKLKSQATTDKIANEARAAKSRKATETRNQRLFGGYTRGG